jgi:hypothetical protein
LEGGQGLSLSWYNVWKNCRREGKTPNMDAMCTCDLIGFYFQKCTLSSILFLSLEGSVWDLWMWIPPSSRCPKLPLSSRSS